YAGRTMLPSFLLCLLLTILLLAIDWYLEMNKARAELISTAVWGLTGAVWLFQSTRLVYRMIAINYRLTNRRLIAARGFKLPDSRAILLTQVADVAVLSSSLESLLGVGRISVREQGPSSRPMLLDGVANPQRVARTIRKRVRQARTRNK